MRKILLALTLATGAAFATDSLKTEAPACPPASTR